MAISTEQVKELRDQTGISVMLCKKALEEADGNMEQALVILRKKAGAGATKKSDRSLGAGSIASYIHVTKEVGAMVMLSSETDFVSKNQEFAALAYDIAMHVAATNPQFIRKEDVTPEATVAAEAVFKKEVEGKPEEMQAKILAGKIDAYLKDLVLLEQPYIKNPEKTIADLIADAVQKFGERIEVSKITRFSVK
jgi:elongation factor Ts